jgi:hypothetical protein
MPIDCGTLSKDILLKARMGKVQLIALTLAGVRLDGQARIGL